MRNARLCAVATVILVGFGFVTVVSAGGGGGRGGRGGMGGGFGGPGGMGPGGPGGPIGGPVRTILKDYDKDGDGILNKEERQAARQALGSMGGGMGGRGGGRGMGGGPGGRGGGNPPSAGPKVSPAQVENYPDKTLYDPSILRTIFLDFEETDWEAELTAFHGTDVDVPATATVDGKKYSKVGVRFRGMSSYSMVGQGSKKSFNVAFDLADSQQRLYGYRTLNLLNSADDPTFMHVPLFMAIYQKYAPAPKANLAKVVVNGESWGVFVNLQQVNGDLLKEWYPSAKGARWKSSGSPSGGGGLGYMGDRIADYKRLYEIKTEDLDESWEQLIKLCRTLNQTPSAQLPQAIEPILDIDQTLWYLATDIVFQNGDGYFLRASDFSLFMDSSGKFHIIPTDVNETFSGGRGGGRGGRGGFGGGGGGGASTDPFVAANDSSKPLIYRLLAVPAYREKYLRNIRTLATDWCDWSRIEPIVRQYEKLVDSEVRADTRKLYSYAAFKSGIDGTSIPGEGVASFGGGRGGFGGPGGGSETSIKSFVEQRRNYLLNHAEIKKLAP
jgi:hypothetical protein